MKHLQLANNLSLPLETVTQAIGILAKRRAGKSYAARRLAEQLFKAGQQIVIVDPKGDWHGIRASADGKGPGLPVIILGGERGDVPLEVHAGEIVGKLVVEERVSVLLDLSLFRKHEVATFMADFLETLYRLKAREQYRTPLMLIIDEADAIAPQSPKNQGTGRGGNVERMLGAAEDIVRRGGQRGIGCTLISQRSAVLNKNVLTQIQMLVVLRTISPQDLAAIDAWIDVHGTDEERKILKSSLPSLPIGDAWFWSPGWPTTEGIFERVHVLPIETFDSGATPKPGEKRVEPKNLADVDLDALSRQMAATIEKAKAEDPKELWKIIADRDKQIAALKKNAQPREQDTQRIAQLETELEKARAKVKTEHKVVEKKIALSQDLDRLEKIPEKLEPLLTKFSEIQTLVVSKLNSVFDKVREAKESNAMQLQVTQEVSLPLGPKDTVAVAQLPFRRDSVASRIAQPATVKISNLRPVTGAHSLASNGNQELSAMTRKMLISLAQHPDGLSKAQILLHISYRSSGKVSSTFAELVRNGWVQPGGPGLQITEAGLKVLGDYEPLPTGSALCTYLLTSDKLFPVEKALLRPIVDAYPNPISKGQILEQAGYKSSGKISSTFARLVRYGYAIKSGSSLLTASSELFG